MIKITEANVGDCVYALLTVQNAPVFVEITKVLENENALEVFTTHWGRRVVMAENAYWEEKEAKKGKIVRLSHNYKQWAKEYYSDEETKTDNRIDPVHNGTTEITEATGSETGTSSVSKRSKRKQKVVRKSSTKQRKPRRNRKPRASKK